MAQAADGIGTERLVDRSVDRGPRTPRGRGSRHGLARRDAFAPEHVDDPIVAGAAHVLSAQHAEERARVWCFGRPGAWHVIGLVCYGESRCALPWVSDLKGGA